jgi:hypothetical protein
MTRSIQKQRSRSVILEEEATEKTEKIKSPLFSLLPPVKACLAAWLLFAGVSRGAAADTLPLVQDVAFRDLQHTCERVVDTLKDFKGDWPAELAKTLPRALRDGEKDPETAVKEIQKLLDVHCLVQVSINPESRVKAARGPARAELAQDGDTIFLVKIHNEAGVTHALKVDIDSPSGSEKTRGAGWLEATIYGRPRQKTLSGQKLEYVLLRLKAREAGKREATLKFDVGQGTQDLGFRAEVPILFTVSPKKKDER